MLVVMTKEFGSDGKQNTAKAGARGCKTVALSNISHKHSL